MRCSQSTLLFAAAVAVVATGQAQSPFARVSLSQGTSSIFLVDGPSNSLFNTFNLAAGTYALTIGGSAQAVLPTGAPTIPSVGEVINIGLLMQFGPGQVSILPAGCNQQSAGGTY